MAGNWFLAPSLVALRTEANTRWPDRDKSSDGSVGDTSHAARPSDHNPDRSKEAKARGVEGIVRAYDLDEDLDGTTTDNGAELRWWVDHLVATRDPRIAYLIYEGQIWRSYAKPGIPAWTPAPYTGVNDHLHHVHASILHTAAAENDTRPWFPTAAAPIPPEDDMPYSPEQLIKFARDGVSRELNDPKSDGRKALEQIVARQVDAAIDGDVKRLAAFLATGRRSGLFDPNVKGNEWMADAPTMATLTSLAGRLDAIEARLDAIAGGA